MTKFRNLCLSDKIYLSIVYLLMTIFVVLVLYPLIYVISCSFSSPNALVAGKVVLLPVEPGLQGYTAVFNTPEVWTGYRNSIIYTAVGTVLSILVTMLGAFPLSRKEFPARGFFTGLFAVTMFIGGGLIPQYLLIKNLHMMDTMWALIIPTLFSAWSIVIARTFISSSIPNELYEAASVDGCGYIRFFFVMVLPLSKALMAVLALSYATGMWNSYFSAMLYISDSAKFPLQIILRNILVQNQVDIQNLTTTMNIKDVMERQYISELLKYSLIVVSSIPLLIMYPFIQKYFIKGVMVGSIKG